MSVLALANVKAYLNITASASDAELQVFIDSAETGIAGKCGPLTSVSMTSRRRGGRSVILLPTRPVISVTSVIPVNGIAVDVTQLTVSPAGVVEYLAGGCFGQGWFDVTYQAGRAALPADLSMGIMEHVNHLWATQRRAVQRPGADASPVPGANYAFTWRVNELIAPYVQAGMA